MGQRDEFPSFKSLTSKLTGFGGETWQNVVSTIFFGGGGEKDFHLLDFFVRNMQKIV
jgi:hypothetical protein